MKGRCTVLLLVLSFALLARAWTPAGILSDKFVDGPVSTEWYNEDDVTANFLGTRYCGDMGYASIVHVSCDSAADDKDAAFVPNLGEVGTCVFGSTVDWYEIIPGVGADAFTATCYMRNSESCGAPDFCNNVELHISGTAFLASNAYTLADPDVNFNLDPNCGYLNDRRSAGDKQPKGHRAHGILKRNAGNVNGTRDVPAQALRHERGAYSEHPAYRRGDAAPAPLPAKVWTGWSYIYSGYMQVIDKQRMRQIGEGSFEMEWPVDNTNWRYAPEWAEVDSSTLPNGAVFVRKPWVLSMKFAKDGRSGDPEHHRA